MKSKILKGFIALLLTFSLLILPSCSNLSPYIEDYVTIGNTVLPDTAFSLNEDLEYEFDEQIVTQIEERFVKLDELLAANNVLRGIPFFTLFALQTADIYYVGDHVQLCYLKFCVSPSENADYMEEYTRLQDLYTDYSSRLIRMYRPIYESAYRMFVFGSWEKSEIKKALALSDSYTDEIVALTKQRNELIAEYYELEQGSSNFLGRSAKIYDDIVMLGTQIATRLGYSGYAEYAYELVYARDYSPEEAKKLHGYVKNYIVPLAKNLKSVAANDSFSKEYTNLMKKDLLSTQSVAHLSSYYDLLYTDGSDFVNTWQQNTVVGGENSYPGAYTISLNYYGQSICYYGDGYEDPFTVIHEQGHFSAALEMPGNFESIDLCEVHSQGNEWLYFAYLEEQDQALEKAKNVMLFDDCLTIIIATACDMFEQRVYDPNNAFLGSKDQLFKECLVELGAYEILENYMSVAPETYWHYALVANSMYYLSYAVSMIPAIEIYMTAKTVDLDTAAENYLSLSEGKMTIGFCKALEKADLSSPFEEAVYLEMKQYFGA